MKDFLFNRLAKDLETGNGNPFEVSYLMLQYGTKGLKPLVRGLTCPVMEVRLHCITCLEKLGDTRAVRPLINMFNDPGNEVVFHEILEAVRQLCCWERMDLVYKGLHSGSPVVRYYMALLLSDSGDENVMKHLKKALKDPDLKVSEKVREAIEIQSLLNSERENASGSLESASVPEKTLKNPTEEISRQGDHFSNGNKKGHIENTDFRIDQLKSLTPDLQAEAIKIFRHTGNRKAETALISMLTGKSFFHKELTVNALGEFKDRRSISALADAFPSAWLELKAEIIRSIAKTGSPTVIRFLTGALYDNHPKIRYLSAWALGIQKSSRAKNELRKAQIHERNRYVLHQIELALLNFKYKSNGKSCL